PRLYIDADGGHIGTAPERTNEEKEAKRVEVRYDVRNLIRAHRAEAGSNQQAFENLTMLIQETIAPETWEETGGNIGMMHVAPAHPSAHTPTNDNDQPERGGSNEADPLVIATTLEIHQQIAEFLSRLRGGLAGEPPELPARVVRAAAMLDRPIPA